MSSHPIYSGAQMTRSWIEKLPNEPSLAFADWDPFCTDPNGIEVRTKFVDIPPELPPRFVKARDTLRPHVPDEHSERNPGAPFNGPRFYLRRVVDDRRHGERVFCHLEFGPSDYRTFLVTNGLDARWANLAGLDDQWEGCEAWGQQWSGTTTDPQFFYNSFGINVLVTCKDAHGNQVAIFSERGGKSAVRSATTVGSADEGLRRGFGLDLFDQKSAHDLAPDICRAAYRAVKEELGITRSQAAGSKPILMSVGMVRSLCQPAALFYWPLPLSIEDVRLAAIRSKDHRYENRGLRFVPFTQSSIIQFALEQEPVAPLETWVLAMALYALGSNVKRKAFLSHSHKDKQFVRSLDRYLRSRGIGTWLDEAEINVGDCLIPKLREAIDEVEYVIAVLSQKSVSSAWVQEELNLAMMQMIGGKRVTVIPVLKEPCELPGFLPSRLFADCTKPHKRPKCFERIAEAILKND